MLIISQYYPPDVGGASTRVSNVERALLDGAIEVIVLSAFPHYPKGEVPKHLRWRPFWVERKNHVLLVRTWVPPIAHSSLLFRLLIYLSFSLSAVFALPIVIGRRYDAVWGMSPNYFCMLPSLFFGHLRRVPIIHDVVDIWPEGIVASGYNLPISVRRLALYLVKVLYRLSDTVVVLDESMAARVREVAPRVGKICVLPNVVDNAMFDIPSKVKEGRFNVVYLGTLAPSYDFKLICKAATRLKNDPEIGFSLLGTGEAAPEIHRMMEQMELWNVFLSDSPVRHEDVPLRLSEADALLLPLKGGFAGISFPSKLGEYFAAGRPVICSVEGDLARLIRREEIGIVIQAGSDEQLASAILRIKLDQRLGQTLASKAREFARANLSRSRMTSNIQDCLRLTRKMDIAEGKAMSEVASR